MYSSFSNFVKIKFCFKKKLAVAPTIAEKSMEQSKEIKKSWTRVRPILRFP